MQDSIIFKEKIPDIHQYWALFQTTGWNDEYGFSVTDLKKAIQNSWYSVSIYHLENLIGFGRVISDGVHHALIVDLMIHPDYQGKGIGGKLLDRLLKKCRNDKIRDIQLFAAKNKYHFYEKNGFEKRPLNAPGMQYKEKSDKKDSNKEG